MTPALQQMQDSIDASQAENDATLERRIEAAYEAMHTAKSPEVARHYEREMRRLMGRRSAGQVVRMEREQGLR